jgi:plastocyanin
MNQFGKVGAFLIIPFIAILSFLLIANTFPFQDQFFTRMYPKPASHAAASITVTLTSSSVSPNPLTINVGDTVTWVNGDGANHMIMSSDGSFNSPVLAAGQNFSNTFQTPGTYTYYCMFHPSVTGTITVQAATATPNPTATPAPTSNSTATPNPTSNSTSSPTSTPTDSANGYLPIPSSMVLTPDTPTPKPTPTPKSTPTISPTATPDPSPTLEPTPSPTPKPKGFFQPVVNFFQSIISGFMSLFHH